MMGRAAVWATAAIVIASVVAITLVLGIVSRSGAPARRPAAPATVAPAETPPVVALETPPVAEPSELDVSAAAPPVDGGGGGAGPGRPHYAEAAHLDAGAQTVSVRLRLVYPVREDDPLEDVALAVAPSRRPGVFTLVGLAVDGEPLPAGCCLEGTVLRLPRPAAAPAEVPLVVDLAYDLRLPRLAPQALGAAGTLGWTERQTNLGEWLPLAAVRRDGRWYLPPGAPFGEQALHDLADFDLTVTVSGPPAGPTVRVIAPGLRSVEDGAHRFRLEGARSIAWVATAQLAVATAAAGAVHVESYYVPQHERAGRAALATAAAALDEFARRFGPYPYPTLTVVEGDFVDGMEYCGLVFVGGHYYAAYDGTPRSQLTAIAAHEAAHQWWHCRVGNDPAAEPWLDEALATFSEALYYEARHPEALAWWWEARVGRFRPRGRVDAPAWEFASLRAYIDAVYLRGALLLRDLRHEMGAGAFDAALLDYATRYDGRAATAQDLWGVLERHHGASLAAVRAFYLES